MVIWPTVLRVALSLCTFSCGQTIDVGGRTIAVESHSLWSGVEIACHETSSTIECGRHKLEVTADSIELAEGKKVAIPPDCKAVKLVSERGKLEIYFDGVEAN
jgi:hypothetical protein